MSPAPQHPRLTALVSAMASFLVIALVSTQCGRPGSSGSSTSGSTSSTSSSGATSSTASSATSSSSVSDPCGNPGGQGTFPTSTTITVTNPGFCYQMANSGTTIGTTNPTLNLTHGQTYTFSMAVDSIHPMKISTDMNHVNGYSGVTNNDISSGTLTLTLPASGFPSVLYFRCSNHNFGGTININ